MLGAARNASYANLVREAAVEEMKVVDVMKG